MRFGVQYIYPYYHVVSLLWIKIWTRRDDRNGRAITYVYIYIQFFHGPQSMNPADVA